MSRLTDDEVWWISNSPGYDRNVRALAQELRERRANDLKPDQLDGLRFAAASGQRRPMSDLDLEALRAVVDRWPGTFRYAVAWTDPDGDVWDGALYFEPNPDADDHHPVAYLIADGLAWAAGNPIADMLNAVGPLIAEVPTSATQAEQTLTSLRLAIDGHLPEVDDGRGDYWRTRIVQAGARIVALEAVLDAAGEQVDEFSVGTTERLREAVAAARRKP